MKTMIWLATLVLSLVVFPLTVQAGSELKTVKMVIPRGSVFVLSYYGARDAGIFRKYGIDAEVDARPFAGFMAGLPSRQVLVGTYAGLNAIEQMNEDKDLVVIGGGLTSMQDVWVRKDSPIQKIRRLVQGSGSHQSPASTTDGRFQARPYEGHAGDRSRRSGLDGALG